MAKENVSLKPERDKTPKYTVDKASGRIISAGPEEIDSTQPLLEILIQEAGWNAGQIVSRPKQWRVPASPSDQRIWPVDIAIFDSTEHLRDEEHVIVICECKRPDVETGIGQLKIYLDREPHARVGIWFNGFEHSIIYKTPSGYETAPVGTPIPTPLDPLTPVGAKPRTYEDLRKAPSLVPVFKRIRDRLATLDRNVNRDEEILPDISLLLLLKILDEQSHRFTPKKPLAFQIDDNAERTAKRLRELLETEVKRNSELFGASPDEVRFQIDDDSIYYVVETLQNFRLLSNNEDAVAEAFQVIRGKAFKGEEGQYFTPQSVVRIAIAAMDPRPEDRVIDPGCGSGSFLALALSNVVDHFRKTYGADQGAMNLARRDWCTQKLFGMDKDSVSVRLSKAYLSMLGDGSTHVYKADAIRPKRWKSTLSAVIQDGAFDVVVTNPPFGTKLKVTGEIGKEEGYTLSRQWRKTDGEWEETEEYETRDLGLVFLERCIRLFREGGRLAIVLPDTYLFSPSYGWLMKWFSQYTLTHSINVPIEAFEPHCRAKTSVIVLKKSPPHGSNQIVGSVCSTFGEDKHGRPRFKFVDGAQTDERDDEMAEAASLLEAGSKASTSKLSFRFRQEDAVERGVLVASYWWRKPYTDAVEKFAHENECDLVSIGELLEAGELKVTDGHGSPSSHFHGQGPTPYVKVVDIKNWRVIENPKYAIPEEEAIKFRKKKSLEPFDLVTPTRASKNIGLFGVIMPWQTNVILTREIAVWRVPKEANRVDPWLLLALASLRSVHDQFNFLVLMQMNREDLGNRYKELLLPLPKTAEKREEWSRPIREFFDASVRARESYDALGKQLNPALFADRPLGPS